MRGDFYKQLDSDLETARAEGLFKEERIITSAQQADITVADGSHVINFCANNYLGLANHPELIAAAKKGMDTHGFGMASVRFICGTQDSHKVLEKKLADFLAVEATPAAVPVMADGGVPARGSVAALDDAAFERFADKFLTQEEGR